jgi:hypothetical protein
MKTLAVLAVLAVPCLADDVVMKDGRVIPWKSLSDEGDSYALVSKDGTVTRVKKADVEKFVIPRDASDAPASGPLTGATFSFGQRKTSSVNLLPKAVLDHATPSGSWKMAGTALSGEAVFPAWATVPFDYEVPAEDYDLTLTVERLSGVKTFAVGVGTKDGRCGYHFDAYDGTISCLTILAGQEGEHAKGSVFKKGQPKTVKLCVRKDALQIQVDGKEFWKGRVPWASAVVHQNIQLRDPGKVFLSMEGGSFKVHAFAVTTAATVAAK